MDSRQAAADVALDEEGNRLDTEERGAPDPGQHGRLLRPDARDGGTTRPRPSALPNPAAEPASYRRPTRTVGVDDRRNLIVRIDRQIFRLELVPLADVDRMNFIGHADLFEHDRNFLAVGRAPGVELNHDFIPL